MASPDEILDDFIHAWNAGERPSVEAYLEHAADDDRDSLAGLINAFLDQAPVPAYSPETLAEIQAEPAVTELGALLESKAGVWPSLLPRLRRRAELTRDQVVSQLAERLGVGGRELKVKDYYHQMETGTIDPRGVSGRVLESLAGIFGVGVGEIAEAGRFDVVATEMNVESAFARSYQLQELPGDGAIAASAPASPGDWDEVDELFRGAQ